MPEHASGLDLMGQRILVTGGSSGIGRATAVLASARGAQVVLVSRRREALDSVVTELAGQGHLAIACDVTDADAVSTMMNEAVAKSGPLDAVVHAAGMHALTPLRAMNPSGVSHLFDVNVISALTLARAFRRPAVRSTSANIVLLSSSIGLVGGSGVSAYAASKAAIASIAKSLALELAREQIRVNAVAAGIVETPLTEALQTKVGVDAWQRIVDAHPMGIGTPEDIAASILFLVSPAARWITGSVLTVDGGYTAQ